MSSPRKSAYRFGTFSRRQELTLEALEHRAVLSAISAVDLSQMYAVPAISSLATVTNATPTGYTPSQVAAAYGFSSITFNNGTIKGDGTGQTIAIVDAYNDPNIVNDLRVFDQTFGVAAPPSFKVVNQNGGSSLPATDAGWSEEIALDVEWAHAMAPGANIVLVEANSSSLADLLSAVNYARNAAGVSVVSMSWGSSEFFSETSYDQYFTTPAGHTGVTFIASAGDSGAQAMWPAISSNVLSVGGTSLNVVNGNYSSESAWSGSGGGTSRYVTEPSYQRSVQTTGMRTGPDVSYDASPNTGFAVYDTVAINGRTGWFQIGGTSAGAPQWASLIAIADQGRALSGQSTLASAQSQIYSLPSSDFHDVTTGSNGNAARAGYDLVTGRGTPIASSVVRDLVSNATATTAPTTTQTTTTPTTPTQTTTTTYQWVYWHHRWWLIAITTPSATRAAYDVASIDAGLGQVATAVASTDPAPAATATPQATTSAVDNSLLASADPALATAAWSASIAEPTRIVTSGFIGDAPQGDAAAPAELPGLGGMNENDSDGSSNLSAPANDCPAEATATANVETTLAANWQLPPSLAGLNPQLPEWAVDACFGNEGWAVPLEETISNIAGTLAASREFDLAGIALALVIGAGRATADSDEEQYSTPRSRVKTTPAPARRLTTIRGR